MWTLQTNKRETMTRHTRALGLALATAMAGGVSAHAGPFDIPESERETFLDVGVAYVGRAAYVGSDERDENIFPYAAAEYRGRYFFNPAQGLGVNLINRDGLVVAPAAFFASGRNADDTPFVLADTASGDRVVTPAVDDAFDLDSSFTVGGLVSYLLPFARFDGQIQFPVTGDVDGFRGDLTLTTRLPLGERFFIAPGVRATYTSDDWSNSYYGIDAVQAAAVGLSEFDTGGGFHTLGAHVIATFEVVEDYNVIGALNYSSLRDEAKDSPLSPDNDALTAVVGVARRF